jgi:predicted phosphodiesterase
MIIPHPSSFPLSPMLPNFRFAIVSDLHIALPATIWDHPNRFHLVEVSIPALTQVLEHLAQLDLDFLLLPGDLTQHGEPENHQWLVDQLMQLPYPVYVVPGNHDVPERSPTPHSIGLADFPYVYEKFGYANPDQPYYTHEILPGVRLIGLNSNFFEPDGKQLGMGQMDEAQLVWLEKVLSQVQDEFVMVMIHHNVIEHLPGQLQHGMGRRYMLKNAARLLAMLEQAGVQLIFTGHLHVQDIARQGNIYEITTGSLVSYPHPYRILQMSQDAAGQKWLEIESHRVMGVPGWEDLQTLSREWMGDRSFPFMFKFLTLPPLSLPEQEAKRLAPDLRYFWATIADGDGQFDFPHFPEQVWRYFQQFSAIAVKGAPNGIDNNARLNLK